MGLFAFFLFFQVLYASPAETNDIPEVRLELGEDFVVSNLATLNSGKVWIENKDILTAEVKNNQLFIKSHQLGSSYVRFGSHLKLFRVIDIGVKHSELIWQNLTKRFNGLSVKPCDSYLCAYGKLEHLKDYLSIISSAKKNHAAILMSLTASEDLQNEIRKYISKYLRDRGETPQKIIFSDRWRTYFKTGTVTETLKNDLSGLGVELISLDSASQLADNVQVSVQIVELNKSFIRKFGIGWPDQYQAQVLNFNKMQPTPNFDVVLNAAEGSGQAKILAAPKLVCRSGKEADFFAGGEFPVKVQTVRSTHLEWKRYGIELKLKPQVDSLGQLNLQIDTEISSVDQSLKVDDMPAVQISRVSSYFDMINKKTISLSGLIKNESSENQEGLPYLQNIPILGALFRSKNFVENKSELILFVTPQLINPENETEP